MTNRSQWWPVTDEEWEYLNSPKKKAAAVLAGILMTFSSTSYANGNEIKVSPPIIMPGELVKRQEIVLPPPTPVVLRPSSN